MSRSHARPHSMASATRQVDSRPTLFGTLAFASFLDATISIALLEASSIEAGRWLTMLGLFGAQLDIFLMKAVYLVAAVGILIYTPARDCWPVIVLVAGLATAALVANVAAIF